MEVALYTTVTSLPCLALLQSVITSTIVQEALFFIEIIIIIVYFILLLLKIYQLCKKHALSNLYFLRIYLTLTCQREKEEEFLEQ